MTQPVISADGHVLEPDNFWTDRVDKKFLDRAPRIVERTDGRPGYVLVAPTITPFPIGGAFAIGKTNAELQSHMAAATYKNAPPGGWDPVERIKDQEKDGIQAEVIYATLGMPLFRLTDGDLQREVFRVYNDWLSEYCGHSPKRLIGNGLISLEDIPLAIKELERCAKLGMKGVMVWSSAPEDRPYNSEIYHPFWRAAEEHNLPVSMHAVTGRSRESTMVPDEKTGFLKSVAAQSMMEQGVLGSHEMQRTLMQLLFGGVFEKFPKLRIVSVEMQISWLPFFVLQCDKGWKKYKDIVPNATPLPPSEYMKRQFFATFENEPFAMANYRTYGEDNFMWASDFPHRNTTWPNSRKVIDENFSGLSDAVRKKIVYDNVAQLFNLS
jgi:predicted TIM-barrel fold metal-dependent hydrolase